MNRLFMKLAFGFVVAAVLVAFPVSAQEVSRLDRKVSVSVENMPFEDFLRHVEQLSGCSFFYSGNLTTGMPDISMKADDVTVAQILEEILQDSGCTYEVVGEKFAIKKRSGQTAGAMISAPETVSGKHLVTGHVKDETGQPLSGAGVFVLGTTNGVLTDADGNFQIQVNSDDVVQFSFLGYKTESVTVGQKTVMNMQLVPETELLDQVVVTALGIKRDEKSLGYATSKVDEERFANAVTSDNWVSGLLGQVPGLSIDRANTAGGGTARVTLRGESSVSLSENGALFVIDGVPMFNTATTSDAGGDGSAYAIDYGDGSSDVNPDDIESVTVLKGPAATALYGSSAANGVILITTKSADRQEATLKVTWSTSCMFERVLNSPDLQYEYGQGEAAYDYFCYNPSSRVQIIGFQDVSNMESWGPKLDGTLYYQYYDETRGIGGAYNQDGIWERQATPYISYGDWFKDFFNTGWSVSNSLQLSGKIGKKNSIRLTLTDNRKSGMIPNTPSDNQFISIKSTNALKDWMKMEVSLNYRRQRFDNIPTISGYGSTSLMTALWGYAPNTDMDWAKSYWLDESISKQDNTIATKNNPYFLVYQCINDQLKNRVYGNVKFDFDITKDLSLMVRAGLDNAVEARSQRQATSTESRPEGYYREQDITSNQYTADFLLKYDRKFFGEFNVTATFGGSIQYRNYMRKAQIADKLNLPGIYTLANSLNKVNVLDYRYERQTNSLYGLIQLGWRNALFLDVTGRNDWSSTLPADNRSYFYPSVSGSVVLNELFDFGGSVLDLLKVRASWAQVGHDTSPYRYEEYLNSTAFPQGVSIPTIKPNNNLRPETVTSVELGADVHLFQNRLSADVTWYDNKTTDLIAKMPISYSTGMNYIYTNAGSIRNRGIEIMLQGSIIRSRDIDWNVSANWSRNKNSILSLGENIDSWIVASYSSVAYMIAYEGGSVTSMYGKGFQRAPEGSYAVGEDGKMIDVSGMIVCDKFGKPVLDPDLKYIGECAPDWRAGISTQFRYKGLKLSIAFDGQHGGHVYSYTNSVLNYRGKGIKTLDGREGGIIANGVQLLADGNYKINTTPVSAETYYHAVYPSSNCETNFVSTQFIKLREIRLEYAFPKKWMAKTGFLTGASLAVYGNNLYCWSQYPGWDPEGAYMIGNAVVPGFEILQAPSGAQFGASVKLTF